MLKPRKSMTEFAPLVAALVLGLVAATAPADTITFTSELDEASDYTNATLVTNDNASSATLTVTSGAEVIFTTDINTGSTDGSFARYTVESAASFDPSVSGPLQSIDWSLEIRDPDGGDSTALLFPSLFQDGKIYVYKGTGIVGGDRTDSFRPAENSAYVAASLSGAVASDFDEFDETSTPAGLPLAAGEFVSPEANPDFSAAGSEIIFGYMAISATGNGSNDVRDAEVRNSEIEVTFIPEPASLALLGLGGLTMLAGRKRRA